MCEPWPGPFCDEKTNDRDIKLAQFKEIIKTCEPDSVQYVESLYRLISAQEIYDLTPQGIKELQAEFSKTHKTFNPALISRVVRATMFRMFQQEALEEIKNGRVKALAEIVSLYEKTYNVNQVETIIHSTREAVQESAITKAINYCNTEDVSMNETKIDTIMAETYNTQEEEYVKYLTNLEQALNKKYDNVLPQKVSKNMKLLKTLPAPTKALMKTYTSLGNALEYSKKQLKEELGRIAAIQDTTVETVAEYFDAYRNQYDDHYASLPTPKQPFPPKIWVEGELYDNGLAKTKTTSFIPKDPATLYAIHRLRIDLNAVPDYLKLSTKLISIEPAGEGYVAKHVTRTGKQLGKEVEPTMFSLPSLIKSNIKDSVIIMFEEPEGELKEYVAQGKIISIKDILNKHFDLPKKTLKFFNEYFAPTKDPNEMYSLLRKKMLKTWSSKPVRANTPKMTHAPTGDSKYLTIVR